MSADFRLVFIIVLVGGAPLNEAFAEDIEADAYCRDAAIAVDTAKKFIMMPHAGGKKQTIRFALIGELGHNSDILH